MSEILRPVSICGGLTLASSQVRTQSFAHFPCSRTGERTGKAKAKLMSQDKVSLRSEEGKNSSDAQAISQQHPQAD